MTNRTGPYIARGRLGITAVALLGVFLCHPDRASAQGCGGGALSTSKSEAPPRSSTCCSHGVDGWINRRGSGERRATAVFYFLISRDVPSTRIKVISYGKEEPAAVETGSEYTWATNRRVEARMR
jgi:hypothetical protein